jgi:hypothetical protein
MIGSGVDVWWWTAESGRDTDFLGTGASRGVGSDGEESDSGGSHGDSDPFVGLENDRPLLGVHADLL